MSSSLARHTPAAHRLSLGFVVVVCLAAGRVNAQDSVPPPRLVITPSVSVSETLVDKRRDANGVSRAESITTISPGVRVTSRAGRIQGSLDYSLAGLIYARDSSANEIQHRLAAAARAEAIQDHLYIDLRGNISRQAISALGLQSADPSLASSNYSQVKSFSVAPLLRGTLGGVVEARASASLTATDSGTAAVSDSRSRAAALHLGSIAGAGRIGWGLDGTRQVNDFDTARDTESDRVIGSLSFALTPELRVDVRGGFEEGNVASLTKERTKSYGGGLVWTPSTRTRLLAEADKRAFGHSHAFDFQHRMRRSVWRFSDRQYETTETGTSADTGAGTFRAFDLFFQLLASQEPDPVLRERLVEDLLLRNNLAPTDFVTGGFLSSVAAIQRRQELSLAIEAVRTTYLASVFTSKSRRALDQVPGTGDLAAGNLQQRGLNFSVSHRLTPTAAVNLLAQVQRAESDATTRPSSRLRSLTASWTDRLSRRSNVSLALRHSASDTASDSTSENALIATFLMTF